VSRASRALLILAAVSAAGAGGYWAGRHGINMSASVPMATTPAQTPAPTGPVIYYRDPDGKPLYALEPKQTPDGRPYRAVLASEDVSFDPPAAPPPTTAAGQPGGRRILYYRNPMGLPDTSPVPKKDWMGMDYIPVYEGEGEDDGKTVKVSLDKVQRSGVRTEIVEARVIVRPVRAVGTVKADETRLTIVTMRSDGYIEDLFVSRTGQHVHAGEPLFRVYSPDIQRAQIDLMVAVRAVQRGVLAADADRQLEGAMQRLRNLGVPESRIRDVRDTGANPRTLDWPSPATGDVIEKRVINGQRVAAGDELYRIADHSRLWVIADVAEADLMAIQRGTRASVTFRADPIEPVEGEVTLIYPELKPETRTGRVRIEIPNPDGRLKVDMYANVVFHAGADSTPVVAVPGSAVIDSGTRQVVLVAKGEGRFEPRAVKLGRRGDGYVEVLDGVGKGEEVVTAATFLIDAESNLKAALQAFTQPEGPK
jgi:membrane fusion protein, copper/silver efflux system